MHKTCRCGYYMSDVSVPNNTALHIQDRNGRAEFGFYCECCGRIYLWNCFGAKYIVLGIPVDDRQEYPKENGERVYYHNDHDIDDYKCEKYIELYIDDKSAYVTGQAHEHYIVEEMHKNDEEYFSDKAVLDRLVPESGSAEFGEELLRCRCGMLIDLENADSERIFLYTTEAAEERIADLREIYRSHEMDDPGYPGGIMGYMCPDCGGIYIPNEDGWTVFYREDGLSDTDIMYYIADSVENFLFDEIAMDELKKSRFFS
ncbi:MAG: hypothetical protein IJ446_09490 [Oscillospiraceae bacterium]|nr:hypothetical protein [Oscillospiraceae bacterium]